MARYLVIKIMRDGAHKAEFLNDKQVLDEYLRGLRSIDRSYIVFEWSAVHRAYVQVIAWEAEGVI